MERARVLYRGGHTFAIPAVSLGIIPASADRTIWPLEAFYVFDNRLVSVETLTAEINVTAPGEAHDYIKAFGELSKSAIFGASARTLISDAVRALH
ncbi:hypothetical protein ACFRK5_33330 [Streptomyces niveus]|uniref:hypothetical protein n=1 Tax=Streptomyces niveus TaxID=193462 RepID=UPI0036CE6F1E